MSWENVRGGRRIVLQLPDVPHYPELQAAIEAYRKAHENRRLTSIRLQSLEAERHGAQEKDKRALAEAMRQGKDDPGTPTADKVETEYRNTLRHMEAAELVTSETEDELVQVVEEHREERQRDAEKRAEKAREKYAKAVDAAMAAHSELAAAQALMRWVRDFPEVPSYRVVAPPLRSLKGEGGEPVNSLAAWQALREDAAGVPEPEVVYGGY
jgi:hypothetical protein